MKLSNKLHLKGSPKIIHASRDDLPELFVDLGYQIGAEVGVLFGEFTEKFCQAGLKMYAIDPWLAFPHHLERNPDYQKKRDAAYRKACRTLTPYGLSSEDGTIIRKTSMEAVDYFEDNILDFIYLDGSHWFRDIAADLVEWSKKVRPGGVMSGHDYHITPKCQVQFVVDAYVKSFGIDRWFVIDKDDSPSWFWVKS